ncbi:MAG: UpxY family transcription antiterminator [Bacteroidales bacterium]|nr:UpxY family transcription antiterminator [Bacteroidales bacterium]
MQTSTAKKKWYALYTRSRAEKRMFSMLEKAGFDVYLPLRKVLKYWSDRKKWVEEPLFSSYIFVCITEAEYYDVLNIPGAVRYVTFEGKAVEIPPQQIEAIKQFISTGEELPEIDLKLSPGDKVNIIAGPMKGIEGELVNIMGKKKVRIEINGLGRAVYIELPASYIR